jgi:hypothetical protein
VRETATHWRAKLTTDNSRVRDVQDQIWHEYRILLLGGLLPWIGFLVAMQSAVRLDLVSRDLDFAATFASAVPAMFVIVRSGVRMDRLASVVRAERLEVRSQATKREPLAELEREHALEDLRRRRDAGELSDEVFDELAAETIARPRLDQRQDPDDGHTN